MTPERLAEIREHIAFTRKLAFPTRVEEMVADLLTERDRLAAEVLAHREYGGFWGKMAGQLYNERNALRDQLAVAREALALYADEKNWDSNRFEDLWGPAYDDGAAARTALAKLEGK